MAKVTVGVPSYNRPELLKEALESVQQQTYGDFVVLVADNASTKDIKSVVDSMKDDRFTLHRHTNNIGSRDNWKYLFKTPNTEYYAFLHDDDVWMPNHLAEAISEFDANPTAGMYSCKARYFGNKNDLHCTSFRPNQTGCECIPKEEAAVAWLYGCIVACSSVVMRSKLLSNVGFGPSGLRVVLDWLVFARMSMRHTWLFNGSENVMYRWHNNNDSLVITKKQRRTNIERRYVIRTIAGEMFKADLTSVHDAYKIISTWPLINRVDAMIAMSSIDSSYKVQQLGRMLYCKYIEDGIWLETSGHMNLSRKLGGSYLKVCDIFDRIRCGWWPIGDEK
jgi:glycosyltransferase involved in cell wall biosynthesis